MLVNRAVGQKEEERASLLGIFMEFELGMPAADTMRLHSWLHPWSHYDASKAIAGPDGKWSYENPKGFTSAINWLIEKRLLDSNGTVNWAKVSKGVAR
jgi:hypothetical protein